MKYLELLKSKNLFLQFQNFDQSVKKFQALELEIFSLTELQTDRVKVVFTQIMKTVDLEMFCTFLLCFAC